VALRGEGTSSDEQQGRLLTAQGTQLPARASGRTRWARPPSVEKASQGPAASAAAGFSATSGGPSRARIEAGDTRSRTGAARARAQGLPRSLAETCSGRAGVMCQAG